MKYKITKPIRLIELFAGIGSQAMALRDLGLLYEHHKAIEIDKFAMRSYNAIHKTDFNTSDITKLHANDLDIINMSKYEYLMTYSFPCQDLSKAGKQRGMTKGSGTRSGLLWEVERLLKELYNMNSLPRILLMENVPDVLSVKNIKDFNLWYSFLESLGYSSYWRKLNAKDYGIPQNRNRCFMISILGSYEYTFPQSVELKLRLKDMLENNVDEKYYLSDEAISRIGIDVIENIINKSVSNTIRTSGRGSIDRHAWDLVAEVKQIGNLITSPKRNNPSAGRVYDTDGLCPTLTSMAGGYRQPFIIVPDKTKKEYSIAHDGDGIYIDRPHQKRGVVQCEMIPTLKANHKDIGVVVGARIRRLTPLECWRLMGFTDEEFYKAQVVNSDTQLYKQAGNSIVKQVLMAIFGQLI